MKGQKVKALFDSNNNWKDDIITKCFSPQDAEDILNMPTGEIKLKDEIIWHPDKKGNFSVKSAYHLALERNSSNEASQSDISKSTRLWKSLWSLKVAPKTKICTWKIIKDIIPNKANILEKGVDVNPLCILCQKNWEFSNHLIWECKISQQVWIRCIPSSQNLFVLCRKNWTLMDYWTWMVDNFTKDDLSKMAVILWSIWNFRNKITANIKSEMHKPNHHSTEILINNFTSNFQELENSHLKEDVGEPRSQAMHHQPEKLKAN